MKATRIFLALGVACCLLGGGPAALAQGASLTPYQAAQRFQQAESLEQKHDLYAAFEAYTEAGEAGHPMAQKKLGDFYSAGNVAVTRDYETALKWYQKARDQGVDVPVPLTHPATPIDAKRR